MDPLDHQNGTHSKRKMRTLASISEECEENPPRRKRSKLESSRSGVAVVIASALSHANDRYDTPNTLLVELGGLSVLCHTIWQLNVANFKRLVVVIGWNGEKIKKQIDAMRERDSDDFKGLEIDFVDQGRGFRGGHAASVLAAKKALGEVEQFVLIGADHIIHEDLLCEMRDVDLLAVGDAACVLVETDLEGMVGLPQNTVQVALRPLHGKDRIYAIGANLSGAYGGIEAGAVTCTMSVLEELEKNRTSAPDHSTTLASALSSFTENGLLKVMKTGGKMWFSVETDAEVAYSEARLTSSGAAHELNDGRVVRLIGVPKKLMKSPTDGGEWARFDVAKWRGAVFLTTQSYFSDLYKDTMEFIASICDSCGGAERVLLIEVGCGTGETLSSLFGSAKYCVGLDFNPKFVRFCNENLPVEHRSHVKFIEGDAQCLDKILEDPKLIPSEWVENTVKVVICVGNTMGIMPPEVQKNVCQQMKKVGGEEGAFVIVYWNGNFFGDALQHFYHKNPELCGKFSGESIDLDTRSLSTPSGYTTHWTTPEEAKEVFSNQIVCQTLRLEERGKGVLVAGRQHKKN